MKFDQPPDNWMKLLFCDPGTRRSGALFVGVPGPPKGVEPQMYTPTEVHFFGELFLENATADMFAAAVKENEGTTHFLEFVMDKKCSDQTPPGFDISIRENYSRAFKKAGLKSVRSGWDFSPGNPNVEGRELLLKRWMEHKILKVHRCCAHLARQMDDFFRPQGNPTGRDKKAVNELIDCSEYAAAYFENGLFWVSPVPLPTAEETEQEKINRGVRECQANRWKPPGTRFYGPSFGS